MLVKLCHIYSQKRGPNFLMSLTKHFNYAYPCGLQLYVGETLLLGLSSRSSITAGLPGSPEPAVATSESLISVQFFKDPFAFNSNGSSSGSSRCVFLQ